MRRSRCARFVLIIDGCYSGGFFVGNRGVPDGMIAITSCSASELSMDTPEGGAFTQSFIRAMSQSHASLGKEGALTVDDAYEFIRKDPKLIGDSPVHPQKWVWNLSEPIVLIRTSTSAFLSYAREDAELAEAVTHALDEQRISLWRDISGIPGGTEWRDSLVTAFAKAQALVLLMSEKALQSTWVRRELEYADSKGLPIVPVVTREVEIPDWFGLQFGGVQRVAINPADLAKNSAKLASTIRAAIKQRSTRSAG
jgi:hypothetical protein